MNIINYLFSFLFISVWWQCQLPQSCQGWKPGKGPGVSQGQYRHQYLQRCKTHSSFYRLRTRDKIFLFQNIPNFWAYLADGLNKFWSIFGILGCNFSNLVLSLWVPSPWFCIFLQKNRLLSYFNFAFGLWFWAIKN